MFQEDQKKNKIARMTQRIKNANAIDKLRNNQALYGGNKLTATLTDKIPALSPLTNNVATKAIGKAAPIVGSVMKGKEAFDDFNNGDYASGALNTVSGVAGLVPGIGQAVSFGADVLNNALVKPILGSQAEANQEAMKLSQEEINKNNQIANNFEQEKDNDFDTIRNAHLQDVQQQDSTSNSVMDRMKTNLGIVDEAGYQIDKANSPFVQDSGSDYDLRGAYQQNRTLNPTAKNGHLTDQFKLPNHPTFSTDSALAQQGNGLENLAINPEGHRYVEDARNIYDNIAPFKSENNALGINTPNDIQTTQNEPSIASRIMNNIKGVPTGPAADITQEQVNVPQWQGPDGNLFDAPTTKKGLFDYLSSVDGVDMNAVNGIMNGLNGGSKDNANIIDEFNKIAQDGEQIYIPKTQEEIDLARNTTYNPNPVVEETVADTSRHPVARGIIDKLRSGVGDFVAGYKDNLNNDLAHGDLMRNITGEEPSGQLDDGTLTGAASATGPKSIMNRIGEAVGTAQRVASNPYVQGITSYALNRANGVDNLNSVTNAINWAGNKAKSDYYQQQINPNSAPSIMGNYTKDDYNAKTMQDYRNASVQNTNKKVSAQIYNNALKELDNRLNNNMIDPKTYDETRAEIIKQMVQNQLLTDELPTGKSQISNNTRKTDSTIKKNEALTAQGWERVKVAQRNANTSASKAAMDKAYKEFKMRNPQNVKPQSLPNYNTALSQYVQAINDPNTPDERITAGKAAFIKQFGVDPDKLIK